jgi:class 3 adenylate cyclase
MKPSIQFAKRADGVKIAYSTFGEGQPMVFAPPWVTSLAFVFEDPFLNHFVEQLAQKLRVVFYDKHGCGQSDRDRNEFTLESELLDLETVVDHLGLGEFNLFGSSMSGPLAVSYAVRHPKRITRLILYGTYADGKTLAKKKVQSAIISLVKASWGLGSKALADIFIPEANSEELQSQARYQRLSSSSEIAANLLELCYKVDVTASLSRIKNPTLILHREDDEAMLIHHGRQLASEIPRANFNILSGNVHPVWYGDSHKIIEKILQFLGEGAVSDPTTKENEFSESENVEQATIMFTDIVASTDLVTRVGDAAARDLFLKHDEILRDQLYNYGGTELQSLGDGFMLSFTSATSAIKCACEIQKTISQRLPDIKIRIGINTGEIILRDGKHPFGQAVVIASRIAEKCESEQILISDVSKQLAAGGNFNFSEKEPFKPKGFNENIKLYAVSWK